MTEKFHSTSNSPVSEISKANKELKSTRTAYDRRIIFEPAGAFLLKRAKKVQPFGLYCHLLAN